MKQLDYIFSWQKEKHKQYAAKLDSLDEKIHAIQRRLRKHHIGGGSESSSLPSLDDGDQNPKENIGDDDADAASSSF